MGAQKEGTIVNISSIAAVSAAVGFAFYSSAKAGAVLAAMAKAENIPLRLQLGSDAVDYVRKCLDDRLIENGRFQETSVKSDF